MTIIYLETQSPFIPDPMVEQYAGTDDMSDYIEAERQSKYGQPHTPAERERAADFSLDDERDAPFAFFEGLLMAAVIVAAFLAFCALMFTVMA